MRPVRKELFMPRMALVVDDSMLIRHSVCRYFEERGFQVESATNGVEALEMLQQIKPDVIVTDLQMPKMGGRELITILKNRPDTREVPIIVLAGKKSSSDPAEETRADVIIYKDIDILDQLELAICSTFPEMVGKGSN
jgi:two-component system, chemotaxis family, chemotaxis protein CheY